MQNRVVDFIVGLFMLAGLLGIMLLAFKVSGLTTMGNGSYYVVTAEFDNTGDLKVRAPVSVSGVVVGRVVSIILNPTTFRAKVKLQINQKYNQFPTDTSASILTQGLLGSNYISLVPGFDQKTLKSGGVIEMTHSALILENLIGQLMFNLEKNGKTDKKD